MCDLCVALCDPPVTLHTQTIRQRRETGATTARNIGVICQLLELPLVDLVTPVCDLRPHSATVTTSSD